MPNLMPYMKHSKQRHKGQIEAKKSVEQENLQIKKSLIDRLRKLIQEEENIGVAFATQKEIQDQWREVGDISTRFASRYYRMIIVA